MYRSAGNPIAIGVLACTSLLLCPRKGAGQQPADTAADTLTVYVLDPLVVEGRRDDLTGVALTASQGIIGYRDFRLRPLSRETELLETVPGLIMTQHSGEGKANQMFVRGFNLDHGTDFSTKVEGMQVNVPTHAHGQGYTDLAFIVPEFVDYVEYKLGNYYADIGDFGSAGGAHLRLRRSLAQPLFSASVGSNGYRRFVAAASREVGVGQLFAGGEFMQYDGPWDIPQDLGKRAGMARYSWEHGRDRFSLLALGYENAWDSSDQIPLRLVKDGTIDRFAQIDSTLGGSSSRTSLSGTWSREGPNSSQQLDFHAIHYDVDLYSNFTYFLGDLTNGDQIRQRDDGRRVLGTSFAHLQSVGRYAMKLGVQTRVDFLNVALRRTEKRKVIGTVRADEATQWTTGAYIELGRDWSPWFRSVLGVRADYYRFDVRSDLPANSGKASDGVVSPKASLVFSPTERSELYFSGGFGFHSNDARGTVQSVDPVSGEALDPVEPLVRSLGAEIGLRATPVDDWRSTLSAWMVELDSELLFVGDRGSTQPSDASRRFGVTWANFYRTAAGVTIDLDVALARARFSGVPGGESHIPGALESVVNAGLAWEALAGGPHAALRLRHFSEYPLTTDNSVRAESASLVNFNVGWRFGRAGVAVTVLNLLDAKDADIQYFYASRLPGEPGEGVVGVHFHPVEPTQVRVGVSWGL